MAAKGVTFVGIDTRDSTATAQSFVDKFQVPYPSIVDPDGQVQLLFGDSLPPQAIPSTVVIDRQGPDHAPRFTIEVAVRGEDPAQGEGTSKQEAEKAAALGLLARLAG
jgi:dsRNA-specific ribonuclease